MRRGNSSREEAWTALHSNISAKLKYPLPACTLSERECKSIMYPAIKAALPKSGMTSTICTEVRDGPSQSGGGGVLSLFHFMGTSRTSFLVEHSFRNTPLGNSIRVCIEDIVLDAGLYGLIWHMKFSEIKKYIEGHSWVFAILDYNNKHNITLDVDHGILHQRRKNDKSIMSLASTYYTKVADLRAINRIRLSFQVHSLSEICSANGKYIMDEYFLNMRCDRICNPFDWPAKYRTSIKDYRVWRNLLKHLCHDNSRTLIYPLHTWVDHELDIWISDWDWFLSPDRSQLLHHCGDTTWKSYPLCRYSHYKYSRLDVTVVDPPVLELIRVSIQLTERFITISNTAI